MKRVVLWAALLAAPVVAQTPAAGGQVTKLITLRNVDPGNIRDMLRVYGADVVLNSQMKTMVISGSADTSGILDNGNPPRMSQFSIRNTTVSEDGTTIRIDRMHAGLRIPISASPQKNTEYVNSGIDQDVDVKEGQKVVVGRSSLEGPQQALFLVLTAHVIP